MFLQGGICFTLCPTNFTSMIEETRKVRDLDMIYKAGIAAGINPGTNSTAGWPALRTGYVSLYSSQKCI